MPDSSDIYRIMDDDAEKIMEKKKKFNESLSSAQ